MILRNFVKDISNLDKIRLFCTLYVLRPMIYEAHKAMIKKKIS